MSSIKIAVDAMGGENSPKKIIEQLNITNHITIMSTIKFLVMKIK